MKKLNQSAILFILLSAFIFCKTATPEQQWIKKLDDESQRIEAINQLVKLNATAAIPKLQELLIQEGDWQGDVATALAHFGDKSSAVNIGKLIDNRRPNDAKNLNIIRALAKLKTPESIDPVLQLVDRLSSMNQFETIPLLGEMGSTKATDYLFSVINTPINTPKEKERYAPLKRLSFAALGTSKDPRTIDLLTKGLFWEEAGESYFIESRNSLVSLGKPAIPALTKCFKGQHTDVNAIKYESGPVRTDIVKSTCGRVLGLLNDASLAGETAALVKSQWTKFSTGVASKSVDPIDLISLSEGIMALGEMNQGFDKFGLQEVTTGLVNMKDQFTVKEELVAVLQPLIEAYSTFGHTDLEDDLIAISKIDYPKLQNLANQALVRFGTPKALEIFNSNKEFTELLKAEKECATDSKCWAKKTDSSNSLVKIRGYSQGDIPLEDLVKVFDVTKNIDESIRLSAIKQLRAKGQSFYAPKKAELNELAKKSLGMSQYSISSEALNLLTL